MVDNSNNKVSGGIFSELAQAAEKPINLSKEIEKNNINEDVLNSLGSHIFNSKKEIIVTLPILLMIILILLMIIIQRMMIFLKLMKKMKVFKIIIVQK